MEEYKRSNLESLLSDPKFKKLLKELNVTYFGYIHIEDNPNQIKAFATALKRIYSIGSNVELELRNNLGHFFNDKTNLNLRNSLRNVVETLSDVLKYISNNEVLKKYFNLEQDYSYDKSPRNSLTIVQILSEVFKIPTKVICQVEQNTDKFEQTIYNAEALSQRPMIELIVTKSMNEYRAHVLISRESEYQFQCEYAIRLKNPEIRLSTSSRMKIIASQMQSLFSLGDSLLKTLEDKAANKKNSNFSREDFVKMESEISATHGNINYFKEIVPQLSELTNDLGILNLRKRNLNSECIECFINKELNLDDNFRDPIRLVCGCWYHPQCIYKYLLNLMDSHIVKFTEDGNFKCKCAWDISFKYFLSLKYCQFYGISEHFYKIINKIKCIQCGEFNNIDEMKQTNQGYICKNCYQNLSEFCGYCNRKSISNSILELSNRKICIMCLTEYLFFNRFITLRMSDIEKNTLRAHFFESNCNSCGKPKMLFKNGDKPTCYECLFGLINT